VIWATNLDEVVSTDTQDSGKGFATGPTATTTTYSSFANFAVCLCEGPIGAVMKVWTDGKPPNLIGLIVRTYRIMSV
jgi:hypothetical protein